MSKLERAKFGSKLGVILATAGSAVGLGNVWRFPFMAGQNGGCEFILIYIICVLVLGIPCMINEFIIGRHAQANTARAYRKLANGTPWMLVGYLGVLTGFLITGYYSIVSGWCLQYVYASATGNLTGGPEEISRYFAEFSQHPIKPILTGILFLGITHFVIVKGVRDGIERASKMMMPTLFILLLVIVGASCMLPGAEKGIKFLFNPKLSNITPNICLAALGQAFFSLSLAMGCICTYASYFSRHTNLLTSAVQISVIDSIVAILAGLMIFPAAFSVGISPDAGPSLIFITLPNVFNQAFTSMPVVGYCVALMFYALLSLAALTSLISLHEVSTAFLNEEFRLGRKTAATIVTMSCGLIGAVCSLSLADWSGLTIFGMSLFDIFDYVTGQIFLPIGGFLTCMFIGWYVPHKVVKDEFTNWGRLRGGLFHTYIFLAKYFCPLGMVLIFLNQLGII